MYRGADGRGVSCHHSVLVAIAFLFDGCFVLTTPNGIIAHTPTLSVGWESIVYIKRSKEAAAYKTRPSMPRAGARAGATGDAGGAAGGKVRSTEAQTNNRECPANGRSSSAFHFRVGF